MSDRALLALTFVAAIAAVTTCHLRHEEEDADGPDAPGADGGAGALVADAGVAGAIPARPAFFGAARAKSVDYSQLIYFTPQATQDPYAALAGPCKTEAGYFKAIAPGEALPDAPVVPMLSARPVATSTWAITEDDLVDTSVDLDEDERAAVLKSERPFELEVAAPGELATVTLEHASRLAACVADATGGLVWDDEDPHLFSAAAFRAQRVDSWTKGHPALTRHFTVRTFTGASTLRLYTSGLGKLGLPELQVESVPRALREPIEHLMNLVAIALWRRGGQWVAGTVDVEVNAPGRDQPAEEIDVVDGARRRGRFVLRRIAPDDDDADAPMRLEISFDGWPGRDLHARQQAAIDALFGGTEDPMTSLDYDDPAIVAAVARARAGLPALHRRFDAKLPPGDVLEVEAPFDTPTAGKHEYLWIEVRGWKDGRIAGVLRDAPALVSGLELGSEVTTPERDVVDWTLTHADGTVDGDEIRRAR